MFNNANLTPEKEVVVRGAELAFDMLYEGFETVIPTTATVVVNGKTLTQPEVLKAIDAIRALLRDERAAKTAYLERRVARLEKDEEGRQLIRALQTAARYLLGPTNPKLATFGVAPRAEPRRLTGDELVLRAEKARRTREARHTLGPRQKAALKAGPVSSVSLPRPGPSGSTSGPDKIPA